MTYAQLTALSRSKYNRSRIRHNLRRSEIKEEAIKPVGNFAIILVLVCLLIVIYLLQVNTTNSYSYVINDLQEEQQRLQEEYEILTVETTKLESNIRVTAPTTPSSQYQPPDNIYFD